MIPWNPGSGHNRVFIENTILKKVLLRNFTQVSEVALNAQELIIHASAAVVINMIYQAT